MAKSSQDVTVTAYFLPKNDLYQTVKPYSLDFETEDVPRSNLTAQKVEDLLIKDLRGPEKEYSFEDNGIAVMNLESTMSYEDWNHQQKVQDVYCQELGVCVLNYLQASSIQIFDAQVNFSLAFVQD